jgi:hypothetical protein
MIQRFLFNWIDTESTASAISRKHHPIAHALPDKTKPALAFIELAKSRTQLAFDAPVGQHRPPSTGIIRLFRRRDHLRNISKHHANPNSQME